METTAADMARAAGIDPKRFRAALRRAGLEWHGHGKAWTVEIGSEPHRQLNAVLAELNGDRATAIRIPATTAPGAGRRTSDEAYVLDLCDAVLRQNAIRQHRFAFLRGDPGQNGIGAPLPVDAWYPDLNLVVEYREQQHAEAVAFFDRRHTVSGVGRGEQRALYDQRRRDVLNEQGIRLIELDVADFAHDSAKRLRRGPGDRTVIEAALLHRS